MTVPPNSIWNPDLWEPFFTTEKPNPGPFSRDIYALVILTEHCMTFWCTSEELHKAYRGISNLEPISLNQPEVKKKIVLSLKFLNHGRWHLVCPLKQKLEEELKQKRIWNQNWNGNITFFIIYYLFQEKETERSSLRTTILTMFLNIVTNWNRNWDKNMQ